MLSPWKVCVKTAADLAMGNSNQRVARGKTAFSETFCPFVTVRVDGLFVALEGANIT